MINTNPIGLFDSGIGGTSIWKAIHQLMPYENTIYLADSKNAPYGLKSKEEIIALSKKNTELLLENNCKIIVVACNTATTNAIKELRATYDVPFIGIEPAIKPAATHSKTQTIGILATKGTLSSELFNQTVSLYQETNIIEQIGYGLVELIENGEINSPEMERLLVSYLTPMIEKNIDYLVLGCSHYPYLIPKIKAILPKSVQIIDSGEAVAKQTLTVLQNQTGISDLEKGKCEFYSNVDPKVLNDILDNKYPVSKRAF
ncbi:MAG: glutamate racemase [Flavobacterium sp.]|jgi:glutamate racemase|nr:glutamate racemase [Flavobacterium sp.]